MDFKFEAKLCILEMCDPIFQYTMHEKKNLENCLIAKHVSAEIKTINNFF